MDRPDSADIAFDLIAWVLAPDSQLVVVLHHAQNFLVYAALKEPGA